MSNLIYNSKFQNLHIDRANPESMKTVNITITTAFTTSPTPHLVYQYEHGLDYIPQFWGLWDVDWPPSFSAGGDPTGRRGYGRVDNNTGATFSCDFNCEVDSQYVKLYFHLEDFYGSSPNPVGCTATFTGYVFSNGRDDQDYS